MSHYPRFAYVPSGMCSNLHVGIDKHIHWRSLRQDIFTLRASPEYLLALHIALQSESHTTLNKWSLKMTFTRDCMLFLAIFETAGSQIRKKDKFIIFKHRLFELLWDRMNASLINRSCFSLLSSSAWYYLSFFMTLLSFFSDKCFSFFLTKKELSFQ